MRSDSAVRQFPAVVVRVDGEDATVTERPVIVRLCLTFVYTWVVEVIWSDEALKHLARSERYPSAADIEARLDYRGGQRHRRRRGRPYWTSRVNALAIFGYSAGAGAVLVVLAYRDLDGELHGMTAWPATGRA